MFCVQDAVQRPLANGREHAMPLSSFPHTNRTKLSFLRMFAEAAQTSAQNGTAMSCLWSEYEYK